MIQAPKIQYHRITKRRWQDLTVVEFELLAMKSKNLYNDCYDLHKVVVSFKLFNSMGRKLKTGELVKTDEILYFNNGLIVVPDDQIL